MEHCSEDYVELDFNVVTSACQMLQKPASAGKSLLTLVKICNFFIFRKMSPPEGNGCTFRDGWR